MISHFLICCFVGQFNSGGDFERIEYITCEKDGEKQNIVMASSGDDLYIAFEGTRTSVIEDVISDVTLDLVSSDFFPKNVKFHKGFLKRFFDYRKYGIYFFLQGQTESQSAEVRATAWCLDFVPVCCGVRIDLA